MAWFTAAGTGVARVDGTGLDTYAADGGSLALAPLVANAVDAQRPASYGLLAGVISGGVCTAAGLNVTIPNGTSYFARSVWIANADAVQAVPDNATTYLWGCSDGIVRQTATYAAPASFDYRSSCLIAKCTAVSGTVTLDLTVQHEARSFDTTTRMVTDIGAVNRGWVIVPTGSGTADVTLTPDQYAREHLKLTGTNSGGFNVIVPLVAGASWVVTNASGQTATVKGASGTGIAIANAKTARVFSDGTNVVRETADV